MSKFTRRSFLGSSAAAVPLGFAACAPADSISKLGKADALWQAKMALRAEGHPLRDWAAWVLTGDPD